MHCLTRFILPLCFISSSFVHSKEIAAKKPNILFILADDLAYNDLGCFSRLGDPAITPFPEKSAVAAPNQAVAEVDGKWVSLTPNLDQMASQGLKFTNYHSPSSVCSPSRMGLMTGRTPARFGLGGIINKSRNAGLPSREITWPEALKGSGYATAAFGKWHLGTGEQHDPTRHGFDHYWPATEKRETELERLTQQVIEFIKTNREGPFLAYFAMHQPHHPNKPHPDFAGSSTRLLGKRSYLKGDGTSSTQQTASSAYHDVVHELDYRIGLLLKTLDDLGISQNTIVVFTSDNGPWTNQPDAEAGNAGIIGTGYPFRGGKFEYWEGSTRVPALIRFPKEIQAGKVLNEPLSGLDWFKTLVTRGGGTVPTDRLLDGFDIWPFLIGYPKVENPRPYVGYDRGKKIMAVSDGRFKSFGKSLVNLQEDFTEEKNVSSSNSSIHTRMNQQLEEANIKLAANLPGLEESSKQEIVPDVGKSRYLEVSKDSPATFKVSLSIAPTSNLVVNLRKRAGSPDLNVTPASLTFTSSNWNTPKIVTIKRGASPGHATLELAGTDSLPIREIYLHLK